MRKDELNIGEIFSLEYTAASELIRAQRYPWEALPLIREFILRYIDSLSDEEYLAPARDVRIHKSARVWDSAYIAGPTVIGEGSEVRHSAFVRGPALVGRNCVVGNSTELKNVILFDNVQVPHYNYVGDSMLGYGAHMGAGSITSNVKSDRKPVNVHFEDTDVVTGLKKFGAILGDGVEIGCGTVLNPGSVVGKGSVIYPLTSVRGVIGSGMICKQSGEIVPIIRE